MTRPALSLSRGAQAEPLPPRGRMMDALEIAKEKFHGKVSRRWVNEHVPHRMGFSANRTFWFEADVDAFIETLRSDG